MKKIVFIGPESTGKTTLCKKTAEYFHEEWVHEYARTYLDKIQRKYNQDDLLKIAQGQIEGEELVLKDAKQFLFCDTDLLVIKVWSEHLYNSCDEWILNQIQVRTYDHYFLCKNDFPWQPDIMRENPNSGDYFYKVFKNLLMDNNKSFSELEGSIENRMEKVIKILNDLK